MHLSTTNIKDSTECIKQADYWAAWIQELQKKTEDTRKTNGLIANEKQDLE